MHPMEVNYEYTLIIHEGCHESIFIFGVKGE